MSELTTVQAVHPLLQKDLDCIHSWVKWKEIWVGEKHVECLSGLLHAGFNVRVYDDNEVRDRVFFYLGVADGYRSELRKQGEFWQYDRLFHLTSELTPEPKVRQHLAQKSFEELGKHVFKNQNRLDQKPSWFWLLTHNYSILDAVLAFFLPQGTLEPKIRNLDPDAREHHQEVATKFLIDLCVFALNLPNVRHEDPCREELQKRHPQFLRVLAGLHRLDLAPRKQCDADEQCLEMLKQIALATKLWLPSSPDYWQKKHRLPTTLDEAVYGGSHAAALYMELQVRSREHQRFSQMGRLTSEIEEARRELQQHSK